MRSNPSSPSRVAFGRARSLAAALLLAGAISAGAVPARESVDRSARTLDDRASSSTALSQALLDSLGSLLKEARYAQVESLGLAALAKAEENGESESPLLAKTIEAVVSALWRGGKAADLRTRGLAERNVELKKRVFGPEDDEVAAALTDLANVCQAAGDFAGSRPLYERALAVREKALGPDHVKVTYILVNLGGILYMTGDLAEARRLFERAARIQEKEIPESPIFAGTLGNLANIQVDVGAFGSARSSYERAVEVLEKALGPDHPRVAAILENLATLHSELVGRRGPIARPRPEHDRVAPSRAVGGERSRDRAAGRRSCRGATATREPPRPALRRGVAGRATRTTMTRGRSALRSRTVGVSRGARRPEWRSSAARRPLAVTSRRSAGRACPARAGRFGMRRVSGRSVSARSSP